MKYAKDLLNLIHKEGYPFIIISLLLLLAFSRINPHLGWLAFLLSSLCIYFFRNPKRFAPIVKNAFIAPADGIITNIQQNQLPKELAQDLTDEAGYTKISTFLSVVDVHVNRVPISGKVKSLFYVPGKFFNASLDKSSDLNERQSIVIEYEKGHTCGVVQIAGLIAKRIVCNLEEGQEVYAGQELGIIRFGSRVDLYVPNNMNILVCKGQRMIGGETILASKDKHPTIEGFLNISEKEELDKEKNKDKTS